MKIISISIAIVRGLAIVGLAFFSVASHGQQAYPSKPIRFIVPYSGGAIDTLARLLSPKLQETLRQPIIVEPRPGANAIIGTDFVAKSAADGYTFLMVLTTHVISPNLIATPYDPIKDFTPVATLAAAELGLTAGIPIAAGVNDGLAAVIGAGLTRAGVGVDVGGTAGGVAVAERPVEARRIMAELGHRLWAGPAPLPFGDLLIVGGAFAGTGRWKAATRHRR